MPKPDHLPPGAKITSIVASEKERKAAWDPASGKRISAEEARRRMTAASIHVPSPKGATDHMTLDYQSEGSRIDLPVMDIGFYKRNPRTEVNSEFEAIKESIRQRGRLDSPLTVTRLPKTQDYFLYSGGNTRLRCLQELWLETQDIRFRETSAIFRNYKGDTDVLASHLTENLARGGMSFWDTAVGVSSLKKDLEATTGETLSAREFETRLKSFGLVISRSPLQYYIFAVEKMSPLGARLANPIVREFQPRFNVLVKLLAKYGRDEAQLAALVHKGMVEFMAEGNQAEPIHIQALMAAIEKIFANELQIDPNSVATMQALIVQFPDMALSDLLSSATAKQIALPQTVKHDEGEEYPRITAQTNPDAYRTPPDAFKNSLLIDSESASRLTDGIQRSLTSSVGLISTKSAQEVLTDKLKQFRAKCEEYSRHTLVAGHLVGAPGMPFKYFMEFPGHPLDLVEGGPEKIFAWWLLASISGQRDRDTTIRCIDPNTTSVWRKTMGAAPFENSHDEFEATLMHELGSNSCNWDMEAWCRPKHRAAKLGAALLVAYYDVLELIELQRDQYDGSHQDSLDGTDNNMKAANA
jgi:ParB family protein of integrating conjugative element (PFGI_1 class)